MKNILITVLFLMPLYIEKMSEPSRTWEWGNATAYCISLAPESHGEVFLHTTLGLDDKLVPTGWACNCHNEKK